MSPKGWFTSYLRTFSSLRIGKCTHIRCTSTWWWYIQPYINSSDLFTLFFLPSRQQIIFSLVLGLSGLDNFIVSVLRWIKCELWITIELLRNSVQALHAVSGKNLREICCFLIHFNLSAARIDLYTNCVTDFSFSTVTDKCCPAISFQSWF